MTESNSPSQVRTLLGYGLLALGVAVFAVRVLRESPYAMPRSAALLGGLDALLLGGLPVWPATPPGLGWLAVAAAPVALFTGFYATMAEIEETVSTTRRRSPRSGSTAP